MGLCYYFFGGSPKNGFLDQFQTAFGAIINGVFVKAMSKEEVQGMRVAGRLAARTLEHLGRFVKEGITTNELDKIAADFIASNAATAAPLNYRGYPKSICTSVNQVICHGIPDETRLKEGDIINIDVTVIKDGYFGDTSKTFLVGNVSAEAQRLTECAYTAMEKGLESVHAQATTGDIGFAIEKYVTKQGYYVVREIGGHGIGRCFHTDPFVPSFGKRGRGEKLMAGTCITIEPMINATDAASREIDIPGSTIKVYETMDGSLSAQFEHTVLITDGGCDILTLPE